MSLSLVCALAILAGRSAAGVVANPHRTAVKAPGLSGVERRAATITSVSAADDPALGLIVRVTFAGDAERYLGQGHLRGALLALVLQPAESPRATSGLATYGGGESSVRARLAVRRGGRLTFSRRTVSLFAPERVLRFVSARELAVIRVGNQVIFRVSGERLPRLAAVEVKVFAQSPSRSLPSWRRIAGARAGAAAIVGVDPAKLGCAQLGALKTQLAGSVDASLRSELHTQQQAYRQLRLAVARDAALARARVAYLQAQRTRLAALLAQIDQLISACTPAVTSPATSTPAPASPSATTATQPGPPPPAVTVVQTDAALGQQLAPQPGLLFTTAVPAGVAVVGVNEQLRYQPFSGLGAALTDSAAWLIYDELSAADRTTLMQDLFGASGIHLNFLRVAMGASGAMTTGAPYTYDDMPQGQSDPSLDHFSIAHDLPYIVPTLQQALQINPRLQVLANPWSPPAWMKSNDSLDNKNNSGSLLSSDYGALADYFVKFLHAYAAQGIPVAALTPQNEPRSGNGAGTAYPGLTLPEANEAQFIHKNLKPALDAAGLSPKIYGNDLSWDQTAYADPLSTGPAAGDLAGMAWHCYFGSPTVMTQLHQSAPNLDQIVDECSPEIRGFGTPEFLISSLRNWASTVAVWSAALDPNGGPIQSGNNCGSCRGLATIDEQAHTMSLRTEYYQLGQISSFVQPGATRIDSPSFVTYAVNSSNIETVSSGLDDVAFLNPDGSKVLIANNNSNAPITFAVQSDGRYFSYTIPAGAMTTFTWQ